VEPVLEDSKNGSKLLSLHFGFEVRLFMILQKEESMDSPPLRKIPCVICNKPVNLQTDLCADENGKAVHDSCYIKRIEGAPDSKPPIMFSPFPETWRVVPQEHLAS
jgi:hypothetical protein